jgi:hypothetical protein
MDDLERLKHHQGGPPGDAPAHRPARRRLHHSPFFWISAACILIAMAIFVATDGFALRSAWMHF